MPHFASEICRKFSSSNFLTPKSTNNEEIIIYCRIWALQRKLVWFECHTSWRMMTNIRSWWFGTVKVPNYQTWISLDILKLNWWFFFLVFFFNSVYLASHWPLKGLYARRNINNNWIYLFYSVPERYYTWWVRTILSR